MIVLVVVSALVFGVTGYAWTQLADLNEGLVTDDVIDPDNAGPKPLDGAMDILLVGVDSRTDAHGNPLPQDVLDQLHAGDDEGVLNTDTLMVIHIPQDGTGAVGVSIPRDSYVDIPGGYGTHKINSAYTRARDDTISTLRNNGAGPAAIEKEATTAGRRTLIKTVEQLTGARIEHYAEVNLASFYEITTAIGGVQVCLNEPARDHSSGINLPAGEQTIQGAQALASVRQRHGLPRGDLDRVVRQQTFLAALARKTLSTGTLTDPDKLSTLIDAIKKSVVLDQNWDLTGFAHQMQGLTSGNIEFQTIPTDGFDTVDGDGDIVTVTPSTVRAFFTNLVDDPAGGSAPAPGDDPSEENTAQGITVDTRNGTSTAGLAAAVLDALATDGFDTGDAGNTPPRNNSIVYYPPAAQEAARQVADALGGLPVEQDDTLPAGHLHVLLGADYHGPGATQQLTNGPTLHLNGPPAHAKQPAAIDGTTCIN